MITISSSRFSKLTWEKNAEYRQKYKCCIYCSPQEMTPKILHDSLVFVVEMNNETNQIEGIGLIRNRPYLDKYYKVHEDGNYNRYVYISKYHIGRDKLIELNQTIVDCFDCILFKGKTHLKRGVGFSTVPDKLLKCDLCKGMDMKNELKNMFLNLFGNNVLETVEQQNISFTPLNI